MSAVEQRSQVGRERERERERERDIVIVIKPL